MATVQKKPRVQRFVLDDMSWQSYLRLLRTFAERRRIRVTYDRGRLELMTLSYEHERWKHLIRRLVEVLAEEMGRNIAGGGSLTLKRRKKRRGLELDECYWIEQEEQMRSVQDFDPNKHPAPELVLEVEVSRSALNRLKIYAALNVKEIWRWTGQSVEVHILGEDGTYAGADECAVFAPFQPSELVRFLQMASTDGEMEMLRAFRKWVREKIGNNWG